MTSRFQKTISTVILVSQLAFAFPASAAPEVSPGVSNVASRVTPNAETALLSNLIVLQGTKMSADDRTQAAENLYDTYDQTAPEQDRSIRLERSLIDMKLLTADQSAQFIAEANANDTKFAAGQLNDDTAAQEIRALAGGFSKGAQFSTCNEIAVFAGVGLMAVSLSVAFVGAFKRKAVQQSTSSYPPNFSTSNSLLYGAGAGFAAAAIILAVGGSDCGF